MKLNSINKKTKIIKNKPFSNNSSKNNSNLLLSKKINLKQISVLRKKAIK